MALHDIAVGIDGSDESAHALRWAAGLADATSSSVRALLTWNVPPLASMSAITSVMPSQAFIASESANNLDKALAEAGVANNIERVVKQGDSGVVLANETETADLVVVGRTGNGQRRLANRISEFALGSTARYCIHHATGPVAAVPSGHTWKQDPTVVVGIDGSANSLAALAWAVENLPDSAKIVALRAVPPYLEGLLAFDHDVMARIVAATENDLDASIEEVLKHRGPEAVDRVEPMVVVENARYVLTDPGFDLDLLIVGERGRGAIASSLLGSVTDYAIRYAHCPVIVVPRS